MRLYRPPVLGPFDLSLAERAYQGVNGIYAVFARNGHHSFPIDVGESADVGTRLQTHDRKPQWFSLLRAGRPLSFEVYAAPTPFEHLRNAHGYRAWIERHWRQQYKAQGFFLFGERP